MNERVKLIRKQLGMTQEQLAQRLGIGKAALSMIETGKAGLSARNRNILVQELNVNPDWLETGKGNMFNAEPDLTAYMLSTVESWGVYAIMIPIVMPLAFNMTGGEANNLVYATIAAVMGGGCFGDHCSPLSDTTILSSLGAGSDHLAHTKTQLPYALTVAVITCIGYTIIGLCLK